MTDTLTLTSPDSIDHDLETQDPEQRLKVSLIVLEA